MNIRQLTELGVPKSARKLAQTALRDGNAERGWTKSQAREAIAAVVDRPHDFTDDELLGPLAAALIERAEEPAASEPAPFEVWGRDLIDEASVQQMRDACQLPPAVAGALMPDAHLGYGLPIGGVLALENAVCPYAVGVDIACRMKLSVLDIAPESLHADRIDAKLDRFESALRKGSRFGVGVGYEGSDRQRHAVMDADWGICRTTREKKDKAWSQLGTSGSGNHFVEFGLLRLAEPTAFGDDELEPGEYVALLSHSGSRGAGAAVCGTYSKLAQQSLPESLRRGPLSRLAWLDMDTELGQEYWAAMSLMGEYAAANHDVIHRNVARIAGAQVIGGVENHHNFAWKETHRLRGKDREVYVHRKGATPAGAGVLGVIPGSMGTPAHVVRGLGAAASLDSASHGAGRVMSRKKAKETFRFGPQAQALRARGVRVMAAGADEVPGVYKDIGEVMAAQSDLVETVATFAPKVVRMAGDGSRPED